jgi:uncharacterized membrane protein
MTPSPSQQAGKALDPAQSRGAPQAGETRSARAVREQRARWLLVTGYAIALGGLVLGFPFASQEWVERFGVRGSALFGLAFSAPPLFALLARRSGLRATLATAVGVPAGFAAAALALPLALSLALATADSRALRLVPAAVHASLALSFAGSLRGGGSLIFRGARWLVPEAPDFIAPYCRVVTRLWALFFAASAALVAALAIAGTEAQWRLAAGAGFYAALLALSAAEFLYRKSYFRYYFHGGPFERLWSRLFPAEATEMGRRSAAVIRQWRAAHAGPFEDRLRDRNRS